MATPEEELRKYLGLEEGFDNELALYDPFGEEGEADPIEEGPTRYNPWKYTEHSTNIQGSAGAGQHIQGMRGRSMWGGLTGFDQYAAQREGEMPRMWQDRLPMKTVELATGDLSGFEDKVNNPYSLKGRETIAGMDEYKGETTKSDIFDMQTIGEFMGLTESQISSLIDPEYTTGYAQTTTTREDKGQSSTTYGDWISEDEYRKNEADNASQWVSPIRGRDTELDNSPEWATRNIIDQSQYGDLNISDDEKDFFIGLSMLSDTADTGSLNFDLDNSRHLYRISRFGANRDAQANIYNPNYNPQKIDDYYFGNVQDFGKAEDKFDTLINLSSEDNNEWMDYANTALAIATISGLTYGLGAAISPALYAGSTAAGMSTGAAGVTSAISTGAITGATGSMMSQQALTGEIDWGQVGYSAAGGAVVGGASGVYSNVSSGAQAASTAGQTGMTASQMLQTGAQGVLAGVGEYQRGQMEADMVRVHDAELRRKGSETISTMQQQRMSQYRSDFDNMFGVRPEDDPYMDFYEDYESAQGGVI